MDYLGDTYILTFISAGYLTFDIVGELSFGADFQTKEPGDNKLKDIPHIMDELMAFSYPVSEKRRPAFDHLPVWGANTNAILVRFIAITRPSLMAQAPRTR